MKAKVARISRLTLLSRLCERKGWRVGLAQRGERDWQLSIRDLRRGRDLVAAIGCASPDEIEDAAEQLIDQLGRAGYVNSEAA